MLLLLSHSTPIGKCLVRNERKKFYADKHIDEGGENSVNVLQRLRQEIARKDEEIARKDEEIAEKLARKDEEIARKDEEIAMLRVALQKAK